MVLGATIALWIALVGVSADICCGGRYGYVSPLTACLRVVSADLALHLPGGKQPRTEYGVQWPAVGILSSMFCGCST